MGQVIKNSRKLVFFVVAVSMISISLYIVRFYGSSISSDTGDWANFATYVSGTVGVAVVTATLFALIQTLFQQGRLINQQDIIVDQQKHQIDATVSHQRRIEAYSRAEKFLPALLESCMEDMHVNVTDRLESKGWVCSRSKYVDPNMEFKDFFDEKKVPPCLEESGNLYFAGFWGEFLSKPYGLAVFVADCLQDAEEIKPFFDSEIGRYKEVMSCALIYIYPLYREEVERVSRLLGLPLDYTGMGMVQTKWQEAGREAFRRREG